MCSVVVSICINVLALALLYKIAAYKARANQCWPSRRISETVQNRTITDRKSHTR